MKGDDILDVLIVDDERLSRRWLRGLLDNHPQVRVVGEASGVSAARELLSKLQPDAVFLDVQMPPDTGFSLLSHLPGKTRVVFVTAYEEFAVKAFDAHAVDYLLKPVHPTRLEETVLRLRTPGPVPDYHRGCDDTLPLELQHLMPIRDGAVLRMIPVSHIAAIQSEGSYTRILVSGQAPLMVLQPLKNWERKLPSPPFVRLDRSCIVNMSRIQEVQSVDRNCAKMTLHDIGTSFRLGRVALQRLRKFLPGTTRLGPKSSQ